MSGWEIILDLHIRECPELRYGQAFCNLFQYHDTPLFYEEDEKKAKAMAKQITEDLQWD